MVFQERIRTELQQRTDTSIWNDGSTCSFSLSEVRKKEVLLDVPVDRGKMKTCVSIFHLTVRIGSKLEKFQELF